MLPEPGLFLLLVLFGGWAGVDATSAGQFMLSRPLVAATLAGWMVGDPATGALLGLILEALNLTVLPVGAASYPESGPAAVAAAAVLAGGPVLPSSILVAVLFALSWAWLASVTVRQLRVVNIRLMAPDSLRGQPPQVLQRRHLLAVGMDFVRAALLVALAMPLLAGLLELTGATWGMEEQVPWVVLWSLTAAGIAATLRLFGERRSGLFALGVVCGLLLLSLS
jgi:mannose/fructose/N-acetylgalactosamine-specific phosphotransferase system component IIC